MAGRRLRKKAESTAAIGREIEVGLAIMRARHRIGTTSELDKICRIYLRELIDMVRCDGCAIMLLDGDKAKILAERGFSQTSGEMEPSSDMRTIRDIVNTRRAISAADITNNPVVSCVPAGSSIKSLICTPIMVDGNVKGIIWADSLKKNAFNKEDTRFTDLLSQEMSIDFKWSFHSSQVERMFGGGSKGYFARLSYHTFYLDLLAQISSAKKHEERVSLLLVHIDSFKDCSDVFGHIKSDKPIGRTLDIVASNIRAYHKIYRYGPEEFAILMTDTEKEKASLVAKRLQKTVAQEQSEGEKEGQPSRKITISIGVATFPSDADQADKLIEAAESALCRAKEYSGNLVCVS